MRTKAKLIIAVKMNFVGILETHDDVAPSPLLSSATLGWRFLFSATNYTLPNSMRIAAEVVAPRKPEVDVQ